METKDGTIPEVSIITPMYNAAEFILATAESVKAQTFGNYEWLIVDDCSTDASGEIARTLSESDHRIRYFRLKRNSGPITARNYGFEQARGRFVAFLDSDDLWLPEKLEKQVALMKGKRAALSYTGYKKITRTGKEKTGLIVPVPRKASYNRILHSDCIMASSAMFDREITGDIRQSTDVSVGRDDLHFFLSILKEHGPAYGIREDLARLRIHNDSITGNKMESAKLQWFFYRNCLGLSFISAVEKYTIYALKGFLKYLL